MTIERPRLGMLVTRRAVVAGLFAASIGSTAFLSGCVSIGAREHYSKSMIVPHIAGSAIGIDTANGSIEAIAMDREDVSIQVDLSGNDLSRLLMAEVRVDRLDDNSLDIWIQWPGDKREKNEGASIAVELPGAASIVANSSNGGITISGLSGHAKLHTSNGSIKINQHDGSVFAETSNGTLQAEHISGEIEMYSSNGKVIVTDAFGPIRAETSNGNIYVSTMDGNEGPLRLRTSNGRANLDLGEGFVGILKCETSNGKVQAMDIGGASLIESGKGKLELHFDGSNEVSAVKTSNGSVRVRSRHTEPVDG